MFFTGFSEEPSAISLAFQRGSEDRKFIYVYETEVDKEMADGQGLARRLKRELVRRYG